MPRSYRPYLDRIAQEIPPGACIEVQGSMALRAALEAVAGYRVQPWQTMRRQTQGGDREACEWGLVTTALPQPVAPQEPGWQWLAQVQRPGDRNEWANLYRRQR